MRVGDKDVNIKAELLLKSGEEFEYGAIYYFYEDKETEEIMTVRFAMDNYYEHCLACEIDPRMKVEGCVCVDQDWMAQQFKKNNV